MSKGTKIMKRKLAWLAAILSGLYLVTLGIWPFPPDFIPLVDEALALIVFLKSTSYLGYDLKKWIPFLPRKGRVNLRNNP